jgi:hypothetical protein
LRQTSLKSFGLKVAFAVIFGNGYVPFVSKPVPRLLAWLPLESVRVALSSLMRFTHLKTQEYPAGWLVEAMNWIPMLSVVPPN